MLRRSIPESPSTGHILVATLFMIATLSAPRAQEPAVSQPPAVRSGTTAVILDVVVRDRRGHPVRDVQPSELSVLEDGVAREVRSFRLVERAVEGSAGQPSAGAGDLPDALRYPTLITFVFDHLTQNARVLARRAAVQFVSRALPPNQFVAVFGLDQRLRLAQPFTRDAAALRAAIEGATIVSAEGRDRLTTEHADPDTAARSASAANGAVAAAAASGNAGLGAAVSEAVVQ